MYESFFILLLDNRNTTIGYAKISQGGVTSTVVDVKIIAKYVVETFATGLIVAHNHPAGNNTPSSQDKEITRQIRDAVKLFDCRLLDHLVITKDNGYYSFNEEGLL